MPARCAEGDFVEVYWIVLNANERPKDILPEDTAAHPLEAWAKGWATREASIGEEVEITTMSGRRQKGVLTKVNPGYAHTYGPAVPELARIGAELREQLKGGQGHA